MGSINRIHLTWAALVAAGLLAIYLPSLGNGLVFDDAILSNGLVFNDYGRLLPWRPRMLSYGSFVWLQALLGEHWLHSHPDAPAPLAAHIRQQMKAAFYTDTEPWRQRVLQQAREALFQAADGLAA